MKLHSKNIQACIGRNVPKNVRKEGEQMSKKLIVNDVRKSSVLSAPYFGTEALPKIRRRRNFPYQKRIDALKISANYPANIIPLYPSATDREQNLNPTNKSPENCRPPPAYSPAIVYKCQECDYFAPKKGLLKLHSITVHHVTGISDQISRKNSMSVNTLPSDSMTKYVGKAETEKEQEDSNRFRQRAVDQRHPHLLEDVKPIKIKHEFLNSCDKICDFTPSLHPMFHMYDTLLRGNNAEEDQRIKNQYSKCKICTDLLKPGLPSWGKSQCHQNKDHMESTTNTSKTTLPYPNVLNRDGNKVPDKQCKDTPHLDCDYCGNSLDQFDNLVIRNVKTHALYKAYQCRKCNSFTMDKKLFEEYNEKTDRDFTSFLSSTDTLKGELNPNVPQKYKDNPNTARFIDTLVQIRSGKNISYQKRINALKSSTQQSPLSSKVKQRQDGLYDRQKASRGGVGKSVLIQKIDTLSKNNCEATKHDSQC